MWTIKLVTNAIGENAYICFNEREHSAFAVDPGGLADEIIGACADNGCMLDDILLTHGHFDHIEAVAELKKLTKARIYIESADADMLTDISRSLGDGHNYHIQCAADVVLSGDSKLNICGYDVEALHTPGHTAGSTCYYIRNEGILFSGDTLFKRGFGRTDLPTGSDRDLYNSLMRLFALPPDTRVMPGHGAETTIGSEAALYR